jgi:glycosyltransferase involved in cell wall biosynthesis
VAARLRRRPLIFDAHELPLVEPNITRWRRLCALARAALRAMMKRCAGVITVSPPIVDELRRRYGGPPAVLVRNIPPYQPPVASKRLHETLQIDTRTRIALYQGNLQADRGLDRLVLAGRFLQPGIVIVLMGKGAMRAELEALAAREGVYDRVFILPPVPYADLLAWTASADAGLIIYPPSYSPNVLMCMPNKLFEYVMAGLPVIASPLVAVEEVLRRYGVGGVIDVPEPEQIGHAISAILSSPESLARMRQNALAACADDLRWEVEVYQLFRLYREVLGVSLASAAGRVAASGAR